MRFIFNYYLLSEREWLDRIKAGDAHVEAFVSEKYEPSLRKALKKKLKDYQFTGLVAEDFCQDIMLRFLLKVRREGSNLLKADTTVEQWFKGNVTNESLQAWNRQRKAKAILTDYSDETSVRELHKKLSQMNEFNIDSEAIWKAIERLDDEESKKFGERFVKQLCNYRFVESMTWKEVAEALNEDFPNYKHFPMEMPLTWEYVSQSLWNGRYDRRLRALLKSIRD